MVGCLFLILDEIPIKVLPEIFHSKKIKKKAKEIYQIVSQNVVVIISTMKVK